MHVAITGASSGIGRALAREFAGDDIRLSIVARRRIMLEDLAASLPCATCTIDCDLATSGSQWIDVSESRFGPVDLLINNAGVEWIGATAAHDPAEAMRLLQVNLQAPLLAIQRVLPGMLERRTGGIINVTSVAALMPPPGMAWYAASKAGLAAASEALHGELRGSPVHVMTVYPGVIGDTAMGRKSIDAYEPSLLLRLHKSGTAGQLARAVRVGWEGRRPRVIYPASNHVARWFPAPMRWVMDRFTPPLRK
jgi:short-subunit dehydrogenase